MNISEKIENIFPEEKNIPEQFKFSLFSLNTSDLSPNVEGGSGATPPPPLRAGFNTPYEDSFLLVQKEYLINGVLNIWDGEMQNVFSPIYIKTDKGLEKKLIGQYPLLGEKEAMNALNSASQAFDKGRGEWPNMSTQQRIKHVENFVLQMKTKRTEIVNLLMWEIGKSYQDSQKEFDRTVDYINDTIKALKELDHNSSKFLSEEGIIAQIRRVPMGTVLCMGPFNYPLNETFTTLIPALIMGNTIVFKPPKHGVLLHYPLLKLFQECFPKGVVNTVYGAGHAIIPPMMTSGKIDVLAFIGSSRVANSLKKQHPKLNRLRCVLGLDAKNPAIILPDADLEQTVKECILGALSYNGQRCTALKILFVHETIVDKFLDKMSLAIESLKIGMPWDDNVNITPLPEPDKPKYLKEVLDDAKQLGAKIINEHGGKINNSFVFPSLVYPVNEKMKLYSEEQFGPVVPVVPFTDIEVPISYVEESNFGQQVSIFSNNPDAIAKIVDPLIHQVCRVNINSQCQRGPDVYPFAGRKDSAETTLSVSDALRAFSIRTMVATKGTESNKEIVSDILQKRKSKFLSTDFIL
ncbi:MAG: NADP-dependent glyceraldehyde-3-phosphate dehydrogenase [Candidatus Sericytochromatia bacterium]